MKAEGASPFRPAALDCLVVRIAGEVEMIENQRVVVVDIQMPFWSMVVFLVKLAIAFIPAGIILTVLGAIAAAVISAIGLSFH